MARLLGGGTTLGLLGVFVFFAISGYLVTRSALSSTSVLRYLWKRLLRIYPALLVCAGVTAFVLGPIYSQLGARAYLASREGWTYAALAVLPNLRDSIGTVQFYPGGWSVNASLWTIPQEIACYLIVAGLAAARWLRLWIVLALAGLAWLFCWAPLGVEAPGRVWQFVLVAPAFFTGSAVYLASARGLLSPGMGLISLALLLVFAALGWSRQAFPILGSCPVLLLAMSSRIRLPRLTRLGDISYGVYLYGFPAALVARSLLGSTASWLTVFAISLPAACLLGLLSWRLIERPALALKSIPFTRFRARVAASRQGAFQPGEGVTRSGGSA